MERKDYKCAICFWYRHKEGRNVCCFNAPAMISGTGTGWSKWQWPIVEPDDVCSEISLKER